MPVEQGVVGEGEVDEGFGGEIVDYVEDQLGGEGIERVLRLLGGWNDGHVGGLRSMERFRLLASCGFDRRALELVRARVRD